MTDETVPDTQPEQPTQPPATEPTGKDKAHDTGKRGDATKPADPLRGSRTSGLWAAVIGLGLILVLLIIFIAQNTQDVSVTFLSWSGTAPLAVALLAATVAGLFLAGVAGTMRILQLRRRVRRS